MAENGEKNSVNGTSNGASGTMNGTNGSSNGKGKIVGDADVPPNAITKHWVRMYRAVPQVNFPFTNLNITFTLCSGAFLWVTRIICFKTLVHVFGWPKEDRATAEAVGSMIAIFHSTNLLPGLAVALTAQPYRPSGHITTAPLWYQEFVTALLQFCTGYMIYDSLASFLILKGPANLVASDFLFLGHHFATSLYMTQTRVLQAGHTSAMICMILGEITNPFHNSYYVASHALKFACCNGVWMQKFHDFVAMGFAYSYFSMRTMLAPPFLVHLTGDLLFSKTRINIPLVIRLSWIFMIWAVVLGSYDWIMECWRMIQESRGIIMDDNSATTESMQESDTATGEL